MQTKLYAAKPGHLNSLFVLFVFFVVRNLTGDEKHAREKNVSEPTNRPFFCRSYNHASYTLYRKAP